MTGPRITEPDVVATPEDEGEFVETILDEEGDDEGSPQPPVEGAQPGAEAPPAKAPDTQAQPRDDSGRFAPKGDEPAPGGPATDVAPAADAPPPPTTEGAAESAKPYTFRAGKQDWQVQGAQLDKDGHLTIPKDRVAEVSALMAEGVEHRTGFRKMLADVRQEADRKVAESTFAAERGNAVMERMESIVTDFRSLKGIDEAGFNDLAALADRYPESGLLKFLVGSALEWPQLQLAAEKAAFAKEQEAFRSGNAVEQQATETKQLQGALAQHVAEIAPQFPGVDQAKLLQKLSANPALYFFRAEKDLPLPEGGVLRKGEVGVRLDAIEQEFAFADDMVKTTRAAQTAAAATEKKNAAALARSPAPPTVPAAGSAPAPGSKKDEIPPFKSKDERDQWYADRAAARARGD